MTIKLPFILKRASVFLNIFLKVSILSEFISFSREKYTIENGASSVIPNLSSSAIW